MTTKEKIVSRLNRAFGLNIPLGCPCYHHGGRGMFTGGFSWSVSSGCLDVGSSYAMTKCLRWKRWIYDMDMNEIFEYDASQVESYKNCRNLLIEEI